MTPSLALIGLWVAWGLSWMLASVWTSRTATALPLNSQLGYRLITIAGAVLLAFGQRPIGGHSAPWWNMAGQSWLLVALVACGFVFCWWARLHLGRMWSSSVTRKADHRVIDTGPYALVRHPIYTGLIIAALATAVFEASSIAFAGVGLIVLGCWLKAELEERFLRQQLGAEAYDAYAQRTGMLVPRLRTLGATR